jgi:hypothetical protein
LYVRGGNELVKFADQENKLARKRYGSKEKLLK